MRNSCASILHHSIAAGLWGSQDAVDLVTTANNLRPAGQEQGELDLFAADQGAVTKTASRRARLMVAMDALNTRFGRDSVRLGSTTSARNGADGGLVGASDPPQHCANAGAAPRP